MTKDQWQMFFSLLDDVTNLELPNWKSKKAAVVAAAKENESDTALDEFLDWFGGKSA